MDLIKVSKSMSYMLRHKPEKGNLTLNVEGWVNIYLLLDALNVKYKDLTRQDIEKIVRIDNKQRYSIKGDNIRANQGHSTDQVNLKFKKIKPPKILYHGTGTDALASIKENGLVSGKRHYVHLSQYEKTAEDVGHRKKGKLVILNIDCANLYADNFEFFKSENNVWLIKHVPAKYIRFPDENR